MTAFLKRRGGRFHFRRAIPAALTPCFGKVELVRSLETSDLSIAKRRSRAFAVVSDRLFEHAMSRPAPSRRDLEHLAQRWFAATLENVETDLLEDQSMADDRPEEWANNRMNLHAMFADDLRRNDLSKSADLAANLLHGNGFDEAGEASTHALARMLLRGLVQVSKIASARTTGDYSVASDDPLFTEEAMRALDATNEPEPSPAARPAAARTSPKLTEILSKFRDHSERVRAIRPQHLKEQEITLRMFREVVGDLPVHQYDRSHTAKFYDILYELPATWHARKEWRGLSVPQIVARTRGTEVDRLKPPSIEKHFSVLKGLFEYLSSQGLRDGDNPAKGFKFTDRRPKKDRSRNLWTSDDLEKLFGSPCWTGCKNERMRSVPGTVVVHDGMFWLPVLALYTGARMNELAQLRRCDVIEIDGYPAIQITADGKGLSLKNEYSERRVPLHPKLIAWGFLDFARRVAPNGESPLFPECRPSGVGKKRSHNFSKKFGIYRRKFLPAKTAPDFHSFRHGVQTGLASLNISEALKDALMGRAGEGSGNRDYTHHEHIPMKVLAETIARLSWPSVEEILDRPLPSKPILATVRQPRRKLQRRPDFVDPKAKK